MSEIEEGIKKMGFDADMARNLAEVVRITRETAIEECAVEIERLKREILRCDDACFERDKEIAGLRRRVTALEQVIYEELQDSGCQDDANEMIADEIIERRKLEALRIHAEVMLREKATS